MLRRAVALNSVTTLLNVGLQLISLTIISRILSPSDIGAFSVAMASVALVTALREMGVGLYIIQEKKLTISRWNSAVTLAAISAWALGSIVFFSSDSISRYYESKDIGLSLRIIALGFIFVPWNIGICAKLQRDMAYGLLNLISVGSLFSSTVASICLGYSGYGVTGLAIGVLVGQVTSLILGLLFAGQYAVWRLSFSELRHVFSFSWRVIYANTLQQIGNSLPDLIIGRFLSLHDVAIFSRASALRSIVSTHLLTIVQSTLQPKFAEEHRKGSDITQLLLDGSKLVTGIFIPVYAITFALADLMIITLVGSQWADAVVIVRVLVLAPMIGMPVVLIRTALTSTGQISSIAHLETMLLVSRVLAVSFGAVLGLIWVAAFMYLENVIYLIIIGNGSRKFYKLPMSRLFKQIIPDYFLGTIVSIVAFLMSRVVFSAHGIFPMIDFFNLLFSAMSAIFIWLGGLRFFNRLLYRELVFFIHAASKRILGVS